MGSFQGTTVAAPDGLRPATRKGGRHVAPPQTLPGVGSRPSWHSSAPFSLRRLQSYRPRPTPDQAGRPRPGRSRAPGSARSQTSTRGTSPRSSKSSASGPASTPVTRVPLVVSSTMYVVAVPNRLFALDLANGGQLAGPSTRMRIASPGQGLLRHRQSRRGLRRRKDHLQRPRQHHRRAQRDDRQAGVAAPAIGNRRRQSMTMAPLVVRDEVFVGNSGGEFGVRGLIAALDLETGEERLARVQHRARTRTSDRRRTSSPSTRSSGAKTSA